jgi:hypothetical protein
MHGRLVRKSAFPIKRGWMRDGDEQHAGRNAPHGVERAELRRCDNEFSLGESALSRDEYRAGVRTGRGEQDHH